MRKKCYSILSYYLADLGQIQLNSNRDKRSHKRHSGKYNREESETWSNPISWDFSKEIQYREIGLPLIHPSIGQTHVVTVE